MRGRALQILSTRAPAAVLLVRLAVGCIFFSEGVQKFLFPAALGVGRFAKIGIPHPGLLAPFVGGVEITCGLLIAAGCLTRLAAAPLAVVMLVAMATTKVPLLAKSGVWATLHEARVDFAMLLSVVFLLLVGAGALSVDARLVGRSKDDA